MNRLNEKKILKRSVLVLVLILYSMILAQYTFSALPVIMGDSGSDVRSIDTNQLLDSGNLSISVYDDPVAGNLVYENNFTNSIVNGSWNVMLYNISLDFGRVYYKDYSINGDDLDFDGQERLPFTSPLGEINITSNITLGEKILFSLGALIRNVLPGWLDIDSNVNISNNLQVSGDVDIGGNITVGGLGVCLADGSNCLANVSGNLSYYYINVTENITNNITNNVTNNFTNNYYTNITNIITNNITENITYNITNNFTVNYTTNITNNFTTNITYNLTQNITNNFTTNITYNVTNNITYNLTNNITQNITNNITYNYSSGIFGMQSLNVSFITVVNGSVTNVSVNLSGFDSRYLQVSDQRFNYSLRLDSLNSSKLNLSDQRFNDSSLVSNVDSRVNSVNSSVQALISSNSSTNSRIDSVNLTVVAVVSSNASTNSRIDSLNNSKLNVSDQRFNDSSRIDSLNSSKLNISDQRFNESARIDLLNTSKAGINSSQCSAGQYVTNISLSAGGANIVCGSPIGSGGNYTVQSLNVSFITVVNGSVTNVSVNLSGFDSRYLQVSDQRFNDSLRLDSLNSSKLNVSDQRFNDTVLISASDSRITAVNSSVQSLITSNATTNSRIDFVNSTVISKASPGSCPVGQAVQNTTASGVHCVPISGTSGFNVIGSLEFYNTSLTLYFNQSYNNNTIRSIASLFNETGLISLINTSTNIQLLGFNTTSQLDSRYSLKGEYVNLTYNLTNNITQNITYNLTQNITNNFTTNITYNITNNITYNLTQNITNNITNNITYNLTQNITNNITNNLTQNITYNFTNNITQNITNNITYNLTNNLTQNITYNFTNNITQNITNNITYNYSSGIFGMQSLNVSFITVVNGSVSNVSVNLSGFDSRYLQVSDQRFNDSSRIDFLNSSKLNVSDQRFNETSMITAVNSSSNIQLLGFNITSQLQNLFYSIANPLGFINASNVVSLVGNWSADRSNYNTTVQLQSVFLNQSDQRFNDSSLVSNVDSRVNSVNSSVQALISSNSSTNSRIDSVNLTVVAVVSSNASTNSRIDSVNNSKLNMSDQRFNDSSRIDSLNNSKLDVSDQRFNDSSRIDSVNSSKLNVSDQRFNETSMITAVNSSGNMQLLGFNITSQLQNLFYSIANPLGFINASNVVSLVGNWSADRSNYNTTVQLQSVFLNRTDQRFNDSARIDSLNNSKLDASDQRYNDSVSIISVNSTVAAILISNTSTNARIDAVNTSVVSKASTGACPDGYVVQNTTASGVQCAPAGVINNTYYNMTMPGFNVTGSPELYNSSTTLYFNQTYNNNTIIAIANTYNTTENIQSLGFNTTAELDTRFIYDPYEKNLYFRRADFESVTAAYNTPWVLGAIATGTGPLIAGEVNHPGIVQFRTSTTASSGYTYNIAGATTYSLQAGMITELVFRPYTKLTTTVNLTNIKFGFTDTFTVADAVDGVYFNISQDTTSNTTLRVALIGSSNSARVTNYSGVLINNNTWYSARIYINSTSLATGYIYSETGTELLQLTVNTVPNGANRQTSNAVICTVVGGTAVANLCDVDLISVGYVGRITR